MKIINKEKGFTLIELLAVVTVIGILAIILIPNITKSSQRVKQKIYDTKKETIIKASQMCKQDREDNCDMVSTLLQKKYLLSDSNSTCTENCIKNPLDNNYLDNCYVVGNVLTCGKRPKTLVKTIEDLAQNADSNSTEVITAPSPEDSYCHNNLAYDGTVDKNLRYVGSTACNYIYFNGTKDLWKIVGVMNNVDDGTGKLEKRVKIYRGSHLGFYSWDTSETGAGINEWPQSDLMKELNGDFLNTNLKTNTMWYNGLNNQKTATFNVNATLSKTDQKLIGNAKWYLGGAVRDEYKIEGQGRASDFYTYERGTNVWGSSRNHVCTDDYCPRSTEWIGKIALLYPSDIGFAVGGSIRNDCLEKNLEDYYVNSCGIYINNALQTSSYQWLLTPNVGYGVTVFSNKLFYDGVGYKHAVHPAIYLKSEVMVLSGDGSPENPYTLAI